MIQILSENIIKFEISERNEEYAKLVNFHWFALIESLTRAILIYSVELFQNDRNMFYDYYLTFASTEATLQKLNKKYNLYNKELFNLGSIIKIHELYKYNYESFEEYYKNIINILLNQTLCLYNKDYINYYKNTSNLNKIFNATFKEKNDE